MKKVRMLSGGFRPIIGTSGIALNLRKKISLSLPIIKTSELYSNILKKKILILN